MGLVSDRCSFLIRPVWGYLEFQFLRCKSRVISSALVSGIFRDGTLFCDVGQRYLRLGQINS